MNLSFDTLEYLSEIENSMTSPNNWFLVQTEGFFSTWVFHLKDQEGNPIFCTTDSIFKRMGDKFRLVRLYPISYYPLHCVFSSMEASIAYAKLARPMWDSEGPGLTNGMKERD